MQETRSIQQGALTEKVYYISQYCIVKESAVFKNPILVLRKSEQLCNIDRVLLLCGLKIKDRIDNISFTLERNDERS